MDTELWVGTLVFGDDRRATGALQRYGVTDTTLRPLGQLDLGNPAWLEARDGLLWVGLHLPDSALVCVDLVSGQMVGQPIHTGDADACHLAVSPSGEWLALAHYTGGSLTIFGTGSGGGGPRMVEHRRLHGNSGIDPARQEAPHPHHVQWLDDTRLMVCDLGADLVRSLSWDDVTLVEGPPLALPAGFGPRHLVLRSSEHLDEVAVVGELSGEVATFSRARDEDGPWEPVDRITATLVGGTSPSAIRQVSRTELVVANRGVNTLAFLTWDEDGSLTLVDEVDSGGDHPRDVVVHEGRIWVAHQQSDDLTVLADSTHGWRIIDRFPAPHAAALCFVQTFGPRPGDEPR